MLLIMCQTMIVSATRAADPPSTANPPVNSSSSSSSSSSSTPSTGDSSLKGSAKVIEVHVQNVRDVGLDLKRALQSASSLYDEVTREPVVVGSRPEVIGFQVITLPDVSFDSSQTLPARKEWVDHYVFEIDKVLTLLDSDVDKVRAGELELKWPPGTEEMFTQLLTDWMNGVEKAYGKFKQLKSITVSPPYDNLAIAKSISELRKDILAVDKVRKNVYSKLQKHGGRFNPSPAGIPQPNP